MSEKQNEAVMFVVYTVEDKSEGVFFSDEDEAKFAAGQRDSGFMEAALADVVNDGWTTKDEPLEIIKVKITPHFVDLTDAENRKSIMEKDK